MSQKEQLKNIQDFSEYLLNLPGLLGEIQDYIYGTMIYPSRAGAGIAALNTLSILFQKTVTIEYYSGISLNWLFIVMAPTGFGKETIRKGIIKILEVHEEQYSETYADAKEIFAQIKLQLPASSQKLHSILEDNNSTAFFADEVAEWLVQTSSNSNRQDAVAYIMAASTKTINDKVTPSESMANNYKPVENPRISIFATTTGQRLMETLTMSQGDSGTYNRMMFMPLEQEIPAKRYDGQVYEISEQLRSSLKKIFFRNKALSLNKEARRYWKLCDEKIFEPLKRSDPTLAGRLGEQCVSMAGIFCLSRNGKEINYDDMQSAAHIRLNMYYRTKAFLKEYGGIQNQTPILNAAEQVYALLLEKKTMTLGIIADRSRQYKKLDVRDRDAVIRYLQNTYSCKFEKSERGYPQLSLPDDSDD